MIVSFKKLHFGYLLLSFITLLSACSIKENKQIPYPLKDRTTDSKLIANEMEQVLIENIMNLWYPRCVDTIYGGYLCGYDKVWNQKEKQAKFIVTQGRHTWAAAQMAKMYPENLMYQEISKHGYEYLRDVMWDKENGGFYTTTNREGKVLSNEDSEGTKIAYGNAFAIYGLVAYFEVSGDSSALMFAQEVFSWLDEHAHDPEFGGYFQFLLYDGTPLVDGFNGTPPKDQNSSIHIIEAFTELYKEWDDELLKSRINEMLEIIRDTIVTEKGYMNLFFRKDWSPVYYADEIFKPERNKHIFDYISFGHDIETAYLLMEASEVIGIENDIKTLEISKKMTDHTIQNGWDSKTGAIYDAGYYFDDKNTMTILKHETAWWSSVEAFHTMLIMSKLYPKDPIDYYDNFAITWNYCKNYLIDWENGGWYIAGLNEEPKAIESDKGGVWKGNYHNARSLIECIKILRDQEEHSNIKH